MPQHIRAGIAGAGFISDYHIEGLQTAGAEVVCIASRTLQRARAKARQFGIVEATTDIAGMMQRSDLDLIVIATPDTTHESLAMEAIAAGRPVLLQKPMARTAESAERIRVTAETAGVPLFVSFMHRYFEEVVALQELLASGRLGRITNIRQRNATPGADWAGWFYDAKQSGGVVAQLGIHGIDLLRYLFGEIQDVLAIEATGRATRRLQDGTDVTVDTPDLSVAIYRFADDLIATHEMSYQEIAGTDRFRMEVYGEYGTAWLRTERGLLSYALADDHEKNWQTPLLPETPYGLRQHVHVLAMLRGEMPIDTSAQDGVRSLRIVETIETSAAHACWKSAV